MAGIYLHIPFCKQACHYCDFHFSTNTANKNQLLDAIATELISRSGEFKNEVVSTIYFGGGTPSLLAYVEVAKLLDTVYDYYNLSDNIEVTLEANPDDISSERFREYYILGINRLSIGVQSFNDQELKYMNRAHDSKMALQCIKDVYNIGFENITIDLIYGSHVLTDNVWRNNIEIATNLNIPHISSYALTIEPQTVFGKRLKQGKLSDIDDYKQSNHYNILMDSLGTAGYEHYEISNFAKPGFYSKHNSNYWNRVPYIGVGPSAHSFIGQTRRWNISNNKKYIKLIEQEGNYYETETLTDSAIFNETIMTGLRTNWGVDLTKFSSNYITQVNEILDNNIDAKHYLIKDNVLILTTEGKHFADKIASELFIV